MAGVDDLRRTLGRIRDAGRVAYEIGVTTTAPASGVVQVDLGDKTVKVHVPGTFRANVASGQTVRVARTQNTRVLDSVLTALTAPAVTAPPSAVSGSSPTSSGQGGFTASGYSNAGFTSQDFQVALYAEAIAAVTVAHAGDINDLVARVEDLESALNTIRSALADLRTALINQGNVSAP